MAETLLSPGTLLRENDQSQTKPQPIEVGAAIIGPTSKGQVEIPTIVSSYGEYLNLFGDKIVSGSNTYSYFTTIAVNNYFQSGGTSMLVTRVTSGSFTPAISQDLFSSGSAIPFILETISEGEIMNSESTEDSKGALELGSKDNIRWEIPTVNTASGTFSLIIRRGDDITNKKIVLESYNNLSLDPYASNYITKVIGDLNKTLKTDDGYYIEEMGSFPNASKYVRVKQVNTPTPNYFDNTGTAKVEYVDLMPLKSSGSFDGATGSNISSTEMKFYQNIDGTNSQGLVAEDYTNAISLLSNIDDYKFNSIIIPGLIANEANHASAINSLINNSIYRGDSLAVIDLVPFGSTVATAITKAGGFDSSYAAAYHPWLQTIDPSTGEFIYVPPSTMIQGVYAFTDSTSEPWFAPAGITRGSLGRVIRAERKLSVAQRDALYEANINPIATFPRTGVVVFGQKTLQKTKSATDRINVRRLLIDIKSEIGQIADNLVFDGNTIANRNLFLSQVNPFLESVQQRQGLYSFYVEMSDLNNTNDVIDRNEMVGQIFIQPTKTAEFIILDFNITPTGASFPS